MPFKSKAQQRKLYAMKSRGQLPGVDLDEWASKTNFKKLPERVKESHFLLIPMFSKIAASLFNPKKSPPVPAHVLQSEMIESAKQDKMKGMTPVEYRNELTARRTGIVQKNRESAKAA